MKASSKKALSALLALVMAVSMLSMSALADETANTITCGGVTLQFGDPDMEPTWPENVMSLNGSNGSYTAVYGGSDTAYYYPDTLSLYADCGDTSLTLTGSGVKFATYVDTVETLHDSLTTTANGADLFTLKIQSAGTVTITGGSSTITISFSAPKSDFPTSDSTPTALEGYLPIGQYASGSGWGSPYSDGTAAEGTTPKVVGAYSSTGISLGAAGGYVEYEMNVTNSSTTPYGVDFIVYGNAFNGNPEAASVKVYGTPADGTAPGWYELAGSLYYADETVRGADLTYKKVTTTDDTFSTAGIWYKVTKGNQMLRNWTKFNSNTAVTWWPEESEGYLGTNGVWGHADDVVVSTDQTEITYKNVTLIRDTDTTADYTFGYADITPNGSSYGEPINPYAAYTSGVTGGDAYDISWAVNADGEPVRLSAISKIRVYTSAALKVSGSGELSTAGNPLFTTPSIFGETSAEVCGVYAVTGSGSGGTTPKASISATVAVDNVNDVRVSATQRLVTVTVPSGTDTVTVSATSSASSFMFGDAAVTSGSGSASFARADGATQYFRVIAQDGSKQAMVSVVKVVFE